MKCWKIVSRFIKHIVCVFGKVQFIIVIFYFSRSSEITVSTVQPCSSWLRITWPEFWASNWAQPSSFEFASEIWSRKWIRQIQVQKHHLHLANDKQKDMKLLSQRIFSRKKLFYYFHMTTPRWNTVSINFYQIILFLILLLKSIHLHDTLKQAEIIIKSL